MENEKEMRESVEGASFQMWQAYCNKKMECEDLQEQVETQAARIAELERENRYLQDVCAELEAQVKQLQRVPLSDDVRRKVFDDLYPHGALPRTFETFKIISRAIEAAHGITQEKQG